MIPRFEIILSIARYQQSWREQHNLNPLAHLFECTALAVFPNVKLIYMYDTNFDAHDAHFD
jgi:hypothetical protein